MPRLTADELRTTTRAIFAAVGAGDENAAIVGDALVDAELSGHESHGLIRVAEYVGQVRDGAIDPSARPEIAREGGTTIVVDGNWGFGQPVATFATGALIERTMEHGAAAVAIRNCAHVGRAGVYPEMAAERGLVAFSFVNGGGTKPRVVPHCGGRPVFGTNPLAAAVPMQGDRPVVVDFSTAVVASGKIRVLRDRGELLPDGWILDREGRPSNRPEDYYAGGMLLPAAAHKGYGLCILVELLAGLVTGAGSLAVPESNYRLGNGMFMQAFDVGAFGSMDDFAALARSLADAVRETPPAEGCEEVLLPGDPERRIAEERIAGGVEVADSTWHAVADAAASVGVAV